MTTRNSLRQAMQAHDLGPSLTRWKAQADALGIRRHSMKEMRESILGISHATEKYVTTIEQLVADKKVADAFRDLLNGLQLQLRTEVALYREWLTPPRGAGA